ncbi:hypothetical protein [Campylobacter mucosalis]|uniref:hypothetical protein n=1 Tax=Campylobacter mucosalis TaxID=202 RepID=UPI0014700B5A|nr:hypothetical protein [Campylobacter mucosalis]
MQRDAFSLLEVIFSIVIVALVSVAVPFAIKTSSVMNAKSISQEKILIAKTKLEQVIELPYTCMYINQYPELMLPMFIKDTSENFYTKNNLNRSNHRYFKQISGLSNTCNSDQQSIESLDGKTFDVAIDDQLENRFITNSSYTLSVKEEKNPFKFQNDNTDIFDTKLITIVIAPSSDENLNQEIRLFTSVSNIGEVSGLDIKEMR